MKVETVGTWIAVAAAIFGIGAGWANLANRIDRLSDKVEHLEMDKASAACLAILNRQIRSIEHGRENVKAQIAELGDRYGCGVPSARPDIHGSSQLDEERIRPMVGLDRYLLGALTSIDNQMASPKKERSNSNTGSR
jgi:hypothetical protein